MKTALGDSKHVYHEPHGYFHVSEIEAIRLAADNASKAHSLLVVYNNEEKQLEARDLLQRSVDLLTRVFTVRRMATDPTMQRISWWSGGRERGHWVVTPVQGSEAANDVVARIERQGRVARLGDLPDAPPTEAEWTRIEKVLRAPVPEGGAS